MLFSAETGDHPHTEARPPPPAVNGPTLEWKMVSAAELTLLTAAAVTQVNNK